MRNEIPLPYYLQHEITKKSTHKFCTNIHYSRITSNDDEFISTWWVIYNIKQTTNRFHMNIL